MTILIIIAWIIHFIVVLYLLIQTERKRTDIDLWTFCLFILAALTPIVGIIVALIVMLAFSCIDIIVIKQKQ